VLIALNGSSDSGTQSADAPEHDTIHSDIENVVGGAEDDVAEGSPAANVIDVGGGNNTVRAGAGDDVVRAGSGNDDLDGGAGNDLIQPGLGADQVIGGAGTADVVDYSERTNPVSVTFDDLANDGEAGEGDNVASDVELSRLPQLAGSTDQTLTSDQTQPQVDGSSSGSTTTVNPTTTPRATTRTVTIRGHVLVKPRAATAKSAAGCTGGGQVLVRLTRGSKVVGQRLVKVSRTCAFSAPVSVPRSTTGTLTVEVRYLGNRALKPTRRTTRLRLG
jgi:hypothetical protein